MEGREGPDEDGSKGCFEVEAVGEGPSAEGGSLGWLEGAATAMLTADMCASIAVKRGPRQAEVGRGRNDGSGAEELDEGGRRWAGQVKGQSSLLATQVGCEWLASCQRGLLGDAI